ncbi:MAG: hypothetical protein EPO32_14080 [Anaerolineae bacterium]|nr:MAG: hypothetical protein EPO32_14080 [Anaerolineae bacterium]
MKPKMILILALTATLLAGCSSGSGTNTASGVISAYLNAIVSQDETAATALSCAAWESSAVTEVHSFDGVAARLENLSCSEGAVEGESTTVSCSGSIVATYQGEDRPIDLSGLLYLAVQEGGEWRMCGYKQ